MTILNNDSVSLAPREIHLWLCDPQNVSGSDLHDQYAKLLNPIEMKQQQRFVKNKHRFHYLITRAFIRSLLSRYTPEIAPENWVFEKNEWGKPRVSSSQNTLGLEFNLSHTDGLICCALATAGPVGLDVENICRGGETLKVANRYFSPLEVKALFDLPQELREDRFFDLWTLKESYIKACGMGLAIPLKDFSFRFDDANVSIDFSPNRQDQKELWRLWAYRPSSHHKMALAIKCNKLPETFVVRTFRSVPLEMESEILPSLSPAYIDSNL